MFLFARLLINMTAILLISYLLPRVVWVDSVWAALGAAFLLGIVNTFLRPLLVLLTLPLTVVTFGLFLLIINGLMLWLVSGLVGGFHVNGFWAAILASLLISFVGWIISILLLP